MAKLKKGTFPGIVRKGRQDPTSSAITENIELLTGQRGNNRALLMSDLVDLDDMKRQALINNASGGTNDGGLPITTGGVERPHAPVNLSATGGFTFIAVSWDHPTYRGHAYAEIWRSETDSFNSATLIATEVADVFSDTVNMGAEYYYWVRFVNIADVKGPTQGAAGVFAKTQKSAELILDEIGGLIEKSHLSDFLSTAVDKIPGLEYLIEDVALNEIPALKVEIDNFDLDIDELRADVDQHLIDIPSIQERIESLDTITEQAKQDAEDAIDRVEALDFDTDSLARQLIESALVGDLNWEANAVKLYEFESKLGNVNARIEAEFLTKTEANEAIAAAAETIQVMIEENGTALSGDIANTYYTKATTDEAIAAATQTLRSLIENPEGDSVGATLFNDYYTSTATDNAIAAYGLQLKSEIEDPDGESLGSLIKQDYSTTVETNSAISQATTQLKSTIDEEVSATLTQDYYTKTETNEAITSSAQLLKAEIEDPMGNSIGATLFHEYSTKVSVEEAVSRAIFQLSSEVELANEPLAQAVIENALANDQQADQQRIVTANILRTQEATTSQTEALAQSITVIETNFLESESKLTQLSAAFSDATNSTASDILQLNTKVDENKAFLEVNYLTKVDTESAISQATNAMQSAIEGATSDIYENFLTSIETEQAISQATTILKSEIEDPQGNSLGATLFNEYETKADAEQSSASTNQQLRAEYETSAIAAIENALANDLEQERRTIAEADIIQRQNVFANEQSAFAESLTVLNAAMGENRATLYELQSTFASSTEATAEIIEKLDSDIDNVSADLLNNYLTSAKVGEAIASADTALRATIEDPEGSSIGADLQLNYYTKSDTNSAISSATNALRSLIEDPEGDSIGALIVNNYTTKTEADQAIATASETLLSEVNGVRSSLQIVSETVATNQGEYSALWGVKSTVNGLTTSLGLVNDGVEPIFAVKGAKFAVITDQDPTNLTPIFAVSDGKTVINTAIIDEAFIKSLVTDDLLANRLLVSSRLTTPSINYNPSNGARSGNFSIDPNGNMLAKSATLQSVTIKDNNGNVVMSSTGAIPSSKVTGLGNLASKDSLAYNEISGRPNLGAFAFLSELGYNDLSGKPAFRDLAFKNSVDYSEVTGKPALGSLAYLNSLAYDSITGKPSLGPFAGLSKILSSNVTTYIANGAIGSAQIDQAYINQLFGQNASFYGTVYAQNLDGDVIDLTTKNIGRITNSGSGEVEVVRFSVSSQPFQRKIMIDGIRVSSNPSSNSNASSTTLKLYMSGYSSARDSVTEQTNLDTGDRISAILLATIPANSSRTVYVRISKGGPGEEVGTLPQRIVARVFKDGSTIS